MPVHYHYDQFPPGELDWPRLIPQLGPAAAAIARYDGMLSAVPNASVLLAPLTTQEAVLSSRIEGTQATMGEVFEYEAGQQDVSDERLGDIQEVLNYRTALRVAEERLGEIPLSQRLVKEVHEVLLSGARGGTKAPGEYRRIPNWIGPHGCDEEQARFVPIGVDQLPDAMSQWERYAHEKTPDRLVQLAILHAEFESIHPFLDGNGRLGRMMVPLFLWQAEMIQQPMFYISGYFEARRDAYYDHLLAVSAHNDWTGWCIFFLDAVRAQAEANLAKTQSILSLFEDMKRHMPKVTRSQYAIHALDWIFERPIFQASDFIARSGIPAPTARRFLAVLRDADVLSTLVPARGRRSAVMAFPALLNIVEGRQVF